MHAQTVETAQWWARPRGDKLDGWIATYKKSLQSRHRDVISAMVGQIPGVTSVLEVGCHCGPNLIRLATDYPQIAQLSGVDINAEAVAAGTSWVASLGLTERIQLVTGRIPEASQALPDRCVDLVLTCYALAYIAPADLDAVLWEIGRLARMAVIIAEPMTEQPEAEAHVSFSGYNEWEHNYPAASRWINTLRGCEQRTADVTPPVDRLARVLVMARTESSLLPGATA